MNLNNTVALITGASSGIGAAVAHKLAAQGARIALAARREDALKEVAAGLPQSAQTLILPTDVGDDVQVRAMVEATIDRFGAIDILVNNAGYGIFKPVSELSVEEFDDILRVDLRGVFLCSKYVLPSMYERRRGTIVTISSIAGKQGFAGGGAYCAAKFGVMGLMECLFHEARVRDVRIVTLTPGSVATSFFDAAGVSTPNSDRILQPDDVADAVMLAVSLPERALIREMDIRPANPKG